MHYVKKVDVTRSRTDVRPSPRAGGWWSQRLSLP